jgi:hypothetical protein
VAAHRSIVTALARPLTRLLAAGLFAAALAPVVSAQSPGTAVEYHHAAFGHYFVTAFPGEIAILDGGGFGDAWRRTGESFPVWTAPEASTVETCRLFSDAYAPKSSHFYTPYGFECEALKRGATWAYEGVAFHLRLPESSGRCPAGTRTLYRLYNRDAGGAPNHRYTTRRAVFDEMRAAGWVAEGLLPDDAFACVPSGGLATDAAGIWVGSTDADAIVFGIVLPESTFWLLYTVPGSNLVGGVVHGRGSFAGGSFASTEARDHRFVPPADGAAVTVSGAYVAGETLRGRIATGVGATAFTGAYRADSRTPFDLAAASGTYTGVTATTKAGYRPATLAVTVAGAITGSAGGCTFVGTMRPRADFNAAEVSIRFGGGACDFGAGTASGIAAYDDVDHALYAATVGASGESGFAFVGVKP